MTSCAANLPTISKRKRGPGPYFGISYLMCPLLQGHFSYVTYLSHNTVMVIVTDITLSLILLAKAAILSPGV